MPAFTAYNSNFYSKKNINNLGKIKTKHRISFPNLTAEHIPSYSNLTNYHASVKPIGHNNVKIRFCWGLTNPFYSPVSDLSTQLT